METTRDPEERGPQSSRVCHARRIVVVGALGDLAVRTFLQSIRLLHPTYRVQVYVLDVSQDGKLDRAIREARLPDALRHDLRVLRAPHDDEAAKESFCRLVHDCDPGARPNEVTLGVLPSNFPRLAEACRSVASRWYFGSGPAQAQKEEQAGAFSHPIARQFNWDDLRSEINRRRFPRRPAALVVGAQTACRSFAARLFGLPWSWLSFLQLAEAAQAPEELWPWPEAPELVCSDEAWFETWGDRHTWSEAVIVVAAEDSRKVMGKIRVRKGVKFAAKKITLPKRVAAWSPRDAEVFMVVWPPRVVFPPDTIKTDEELELVPAAYGELMDTTASIQSETTFSTGQQIDPATNEILSTLPEADRIVLRLFLQGTRTKELAFLIEGRDDEAACARVKRRIAELLLEVGKKQNASRLNPKTAVVRQET